MKFIRSYLFTILVMLLILYSSTTSSSGIPPLPAVDGLDKVIHFIMYFALSSVLFFEIKQRNKIKRFGWSVIFPVLYGGVLELVQHFFLPDRSGDITDFLANALGAFSAFIVAIIITRNDKKF